jgi:hypothetical protein
MIRVTVEGADVAAVRLALLDVLEVMMPKGPLVPVAAPPPQPQVQAPVAAPSVSSPPPGQARRGRKAKQPTPASDPLPVAVETDPETDDIDPVTAEEDQRDDGTKALLDSLDPPAPASAVLKVTRDQLRDAAQGFIQARGVNAAMALLGEYGVQKFAELPEAKWGEMFTKLGGKL